MSLELSDLLLKIAEKACDKLRQLREETTSREILKRGLGDVTRRVDYEVEGLILEELEKNGINAVVLTEERGVVYIGENPRYIFIVDPLDGSLNFVLDIPFYAVSIAVAPYKNGPIRFGDLKCGVIAYAPKGLVAYAEDDRFDILKGDGVFKTLRESVRQSLEKPTVILYLNLDNPELSLKTIRALKEILGSFKARTLGAASLELLLTGLGLFTAFIDVRDKLRAYDLAAAYVILRALGASIYAGNGNRLDELVISEGFRSSVIASRDESFILKIRKEIYQR